MAIVPKQQPGASKQDYVTPEAFIRAVKRKLGIEEFAFDFAADRQNTKAPCYWAEQVDSLTQTPQQWAAHCQKGWGWLNPPFAHIAPWAQRCKQAAVRGGRIAFLVPAGVGANWYRDHVHFEAMVYALNGRLAFMKERPDWLYPKDCVLCLFGHEGAPDFDVWTWKEEQDADR